MPDQPSHVAWQHRVERLVEYTRVLALLQTVAQESISSMITSSIALKMSRSGASQPQVRLCLSLDVFQKLTLNNQGREISSSKSRKISLHWVQAICRAKESPCRLDQSPQ